MFQKIACPRSRWLCWHRVWVVDVKLNKNNIKSDTVTKLQANIFAKPLNCLREIVLSEFQLGLKEEAAVEALVALFL